MRMFPVVPTFRYSWQTAYIVPPPSIATAGSPTNMPVALGIETLRLQVMPPLVENENAHTRVERSSIQPASASPPGPVASATSLWRPLPVSSLRRMFGVNTTAAGIGAPPAPAAPPALPPRPAAPAAPAAAPPDPPRPLAPPPDPPRPAAPVVPAEPPSLPRRATAVSGSAAPGGARRSRQARGPGRARCTRQARGARRAAGARDAVAAGAHAACRARGAGAARARRARIRPVGVDDPAGAGPGRGDGQ